MLTAGRIVFPVIGTHAYWLAIKGGQFGPASALSLMLVPFLLAALLRAVPAVRSAGAGDAREPAGLVARGSGTGAWSLLAIVYCLFPIYFMLVQSLKTAQEDVFGNPLIVVNPTFENFEELFEREGRGRGASSGRVLRRSYPFFAGSRTPSSSSPGRSSSRWRRASPPPTRSGACAPRLPVVAAGRSSPRYVIPQTILFVPLYQVVITPSGSTTTCSRSLLVYPTMALPFCVWMLSAYFQHLPREIEEAALIEGASRVTAFFRIILPLSRPVLVAAGIFTLGTIASDFTIASVFLLSDINQTIPAGLGTMEVALDELLAVAGINLMAIPDRR